ncbi:MAG: OB-fold domain-containing protein [Haloarculaceae archaeon]
MSTGTPEFPARACAECGELYGHEPSVCRECGAESFETETLSGSARLYASTVIRVPGSDHQGQEPFVVGLVDVADAVRVTARVEGVDGVEGDERPAPDAPLEYVEEREGTFYFRPA